MYTIIPVNNAHMAQQGFKFSILGTYCIKYDSYDPDIQGYPFVTSLSVTLTYPDNSVQHANADVSFLLFDDDVDQYTLFSLYNGGTFPVVDSVIFVSYDVGNGLVGSLIENPSDLFTSIISLLPLVIPVAVSFIAIRKGISWVRSKISGV